MARIGFFSIYLVYTKMVKKMMWWILLVVAGNVVWLLIDKSPPAWDQAAHLKGIVLVNQWLRGDFWGDFTDLIRSFWGYPPLVYFIGGLVGVKMSMYLNTTFLVLAIIGVYKLAGNKILPAILFSLFPVIYEISRGMLLDLALTAWVVWGLYFWLKKNDWGVLLMLILASLTKLNGFIYFVPIVVLGYWRQWEKLFVGAMICALTVGWWWIINWPNIYLYLTGLAGQGESLTDPMNLASWRTWIHYFGLFFLQQVGPITATIFIIFGKRENKKLIWWAVITYVIFTIIKNKDYRFTMPLLSVVAVWLGSGLERINHKLFRHSAVGLLLLWMGFNYVENSYNWPIKKPFVVSTKTFVLGGIDWINFSEYPVREARAEEWPDEKIIGDLPDRGRILVVMNSAQINDNTLGFYKLMAGKNDLEIHGVDRWGKMDFDYILVPDEKTESGPFYDTQLTLRKKVVRSIWDNIGNYEVVGEYGLPSGGRVYLLRIRPAAAGLVR